MDTAFDVKQFYDAIGTGQKNVIETILKNKNSDEAVSIINSPKKYGAMLNTPLQHAILTGQFEIARYLMISGADIHQLNYTGNSALHYAIQEGQIALVEELLFRGADINFRTNGGNGFSPLQIAILRGFIKLAVYIIDQGINIHLQSSKGHTALHHAIQEGQLDIVNRLIAGGADINLVKPDDHLSPLQWAIWRSHQEISVHLIERGADVQFKNKDGHTALHVAIYRGLKDLVALLLNRQVDLIVKKRDGLTLLHWAILHGQLEIVEILINKIGSDCRLIADIINAINGKGYNALHYAIRESLDEVVVYLVRKGADVNIKKGDDGCSPLQFAVIKCDNEIAKILLDNGAEIDAMNNSGLVALHQAIQTNNLHCVEQLLERGAKINTVKQDDGNSPLQWAILHGHQAVIHYLLSSGADIHQCNDDGVTALHLAIEAGFLDVVQELVQRGADINFKKLDDGLLPRTWALVKGQDEIAEFLANMGAMMQKDVELYVSSLAERRIGVSTSLSNDELDDGNSESLSNRGMVFDSALHCAVRDSQIDLLSHLVSRGDDVNLKAVDGKTPLQIAISLNDITISKYLLEHGADVHAVDIDGRTPLQMAVEAGELGFVELLLHHGAIINAPVSLSEGRTPLQMAIVNGNCKLVKFLIDQCEADIQQYDENGLTPLHVAAETCRLEVISLLLELGAKLDTKSWDGYSPLHWSIARQGHRDVVEFLMIRGANIFTSNKEGNTALDSAIINQEYEVALMLIGKGAKANRISDILVDQITNFPCAYCNVEVPLIGYFQDIFKNFPFSKVKQIRSHLLSKSNSSFHILRSLIGALAFDEISINARLHICGSNISGKTSLKQAIIQNFNGSKLSLAWGSKALNKSIDTDQQIKRTHGIEVSKCTHLGSKFIFYDYSGDKIYYPFYGYFLSRPSSVFIIVISLVTVDEGSSKVKQFSVTSDEAILDNYRTWLKFINSVVPASVSEITCLTIINFKTIADEMEVGKSSRVQNLIFDEQLYWMKSSTPRKVGKDHAKLSRMIFIQDKLPMAIDCTDQKEVLNQINSKLHQAISSSVESLQSTAIIKLVQSIVEMRGSVPEKPSTFSLRRSYSLTFINRSNHNNVIVWKQVTTISEFERNIIHPEIAKLFHPSKNSTNNSSQTVEETNIQLYLTKIVWNSLISNEEVFVVGDLVVTDINWFTCVTLKCLVDLIAGCKNKLLTNESIAEISSSIADRRHLSSLLQAMGFCLSVDKNDSCSSGDKVNWFPNTSLDSSAHVLSFKILEQIMREFILPSQSSLIDSSVVLRRFSLLDESRQKISSGYLVRFLSAILKNEDEHYSTMERYDNGMVLIGTSGEIDYLTVVIFTREAQQASASASASIVVGVMCRSIKIPKDLETDLSAAELDSRNASLSMWYRLERICRVLNLSNSYRFMTEREAETENTANFTSSNNINWPLHLQASCIDPRNLNELSEISLTEAIAARNNDSGEPFDEKIQDNLYAKYFGVNNNLSPLDDEEFCRRKRSFNYLSAPEMPVANDAADSSVTAGKVLDEIPLQDDEVLQIMQIEECDENTVHLPSDQNLVTSDVDIQTKITDDALIEVEHRLVIEESHLDTDSKEEALLIDALLSERNLLQNMASFLETKSAALIPMTFVIKPTLPNEMLRSGPNPWRKIANAWKRNVKYRFSGLIWQDCRLVFICPITLKEVPCGGNKIDSSNGYRVSIPIELLKPLAPALTFGILYLKRALESKDPLEVLVDKNSGNSSITVDNYLQPDMIKSTHYVNHILEDVGHTDLLGQILDGAEYKSQQAFIDLVSATQRHMSVMDGLFKWSTMYNLLAQSELGNQIDEIPTDWRPKLLGLQCVCLKDQDDNITRKLWVSNEALPQLFEAGWCFHN